MKNDKRFKIKLNAGKGMVMGILIGTAVALLVQLITGDSSVWNWAIPVGLACGLASGAAKNNGSTTKKDLS